MSKTSPIQRQARPNDFDDIIAVLNDWWGRSVSHAVPRLFLDHFYKTSFVLRESDQLVGFLIGFFSPSEPLVAYIHFVGIAPSIRKSGFAAKLYKDFFALAKKNGCSEVHAITAPVNKGSIEFHRKLGFCVSDPKLGYNEPGKEHVLFKKQLHAAA